MTEHGTTPPQDAAEAPDSAAFGNMMAALFALAILYAIVVYVQWSALLNRAG
jgi:hypothetical protein